MLLNLLYFLIALGLLFLQMAFIYYIWEKIENRFKIQHLGPTISHNKTFGDTIYHRSDNYTLEAKYSIEHKGIVKTHKLTEDNFHELLEDHFITVDHLYNLLLNIPFNLKVMDRVNYHFGKLRPISGFK